MFFIIVYFDQEWWANRSENTASNSWTRQLLCQ
jgi:hypothetical protein